MISEVIDEKDFCWFYGNWNFGGEEVCIGKCVCLLKVFLVVLVRRIGRF